MSKSKKTNPLPPSIPHAVLGSAHTEILLAFEAQNSIYSLAPLVRKTPSQVSKILRAIAAEVPALEKRGNRWVLTPLGRQLNALTRSHIAKQREICALPNTIRIGTNREFGSRVIGEHFEPFLDLFNGIHLAFLTFSDGTEPALLAGEVDLALDCGRPNDPSVAFKLVAPETLVAVAAPNFFRQNKIQTSTKSSFNFLSLPHLYYERIRPAETFLLNENDLRIKARFNDIAMVRSACLQGLGWALLPEYCVREELRLGQLRALSHNSPPQTAYGVRWLRSRKHLSKYAAILERWLKTVKL